MSHQEGPPPGPYQQGAPGPYQQGAYQQTPPPAKKKGRGCLWAALGALLAVILLIGGCMTIMGSGVNAVDKAQKTEHTVVYKATTTGNANVSYGKTSGQSQTQISQDWSKEDKVTGWDGVSMLVASTDYQNPGNVTCEILVDGKSAVKNSGSGQGANASCNASSLPK